MFNRDFYPTPYKVMELMGIYCEGRIVLEPQAGKGNLVAYLKANMAKEVLTCELNKDLAEIIKKKSRFLQHDFLEVNAEQISHVNMIVMNPPFSADVTHMLHAWEVAPNGCEIISLCNFASLDNDYSWERKKLLSIIRDYGTKEELGDVFSDAERKTGVNIGLVKVFKPGVSNDGFEGFFMDEEVEVGGSAGIMRYDSIRDVVQRYVNAVKCFDEHAIISERMNKLCDQFSVGTFEFSIDSNNAVTTKEDFAKELQKKAWAYIFGLMNMKKYVTSGVMKDINTFVETQQKVPFTMRNIYKMLEIIVGTREQTFNRSLVEAIDKFTMHTHENRYNVPGWKTNSGYMLNQKFIVEWMVEKGWGEKENTMRLKTSSNSDKVQDLVKVLCSLTGKDYDKVPELHYMFSYRFKLFDAETENIMWWFPDTGSEKERFYERIKELKSQGRKFIQVDDYYEFGKWITWGFFEIRGYKKGTMHLKFRNEKDWALLNRAYAKIKGQVLPDKL